MTTKTPREVMFHALESVGFDEEAAAETAGTAEDALTAAGFVIVHRDVLSDMAANLIGAASAYRKHASRNKSVSPRATPDPFFTTRARDFDNAAERARAAMLTAAEEKPDASR